MNLFDAYFHRETKLSIFAVKSIYKHCIYIQVMDKLSLFVFVIAFFDKLFTNVFKSQILVFFLLNSLIAHKIGSYLLITY